MRNWYPDLKRGEDPDRDARLDMYFGCVEIGRSQCVVDSDGSVLMGNRVKEYGYDGSIVRDECHYNVRLTGMSAAGITAIARQAGVPVTDSL